MANLLGFNIFDGMRDEYISNLLGWYNSGLKTAVVSGNPEILLKALENKEVASLCSKASIIPDGIGVVIAGKIKGQPLRQRIAGIEVMEDILKLSRGNGMKVYMLGAEEWVVEKAADKAKKTYDANIVGYHDGYFDMDDCNHIIDDIKKSGADVLLVAMGCPRQEAFIEMSWDILDCRIFLGIGGSFDVLAGKVKRAPVWMRKSGLEWLYRVIKEPERIARLACIPRFLLKVILKDNVTS